MDIAKYMLTALLLSSVFGDITQAGVLASVLTGTVVTLSCGLYLVKDKNENKTRKGK